jgi:protein-S-isoprenylcysteine O-methyltransferase Ste14
MNNESISYGLWGLVVVNSAVFVLFAYSFFKPRTPRDWRSFGAFSAFLVALFTEMYGFPLTIYFLSGWLQTRFPDVDWFFMLIAGGWRVLYEAQRRRTLAVAGVYRYVRHPQYVGFVLILLGFLVQWPTILTLAMFPVLVWMYVKLARSEERDAINEFGDAYRIYMSTVPAFFPRLGGALTGHPAA